MPIDRPIHPDFQFFLDFKSGELIDLFKDLRAYVLSLHPVCTELLYHTHALTTVFSVSEKLGDAYCHIPIYTEHLNLGFNKGALLEDPHALLQGTGKLIRHIPVRSPEDYRNEAVEQLIRAAVNLALEDRDPKAGTKPKVISKIKR